MQKSKFVSPLLPSFINPMQKRNTLSADRYFTPADLTGLSWLGCLLLSKPAMAHHKSACSARWRWEFRCVRLFCPRCTRRYLPTVDGIHPGRKQPTQPEVISERWTSNQFVISCFFLNQCWVFFRVAATAVNFCANSRFLKQSVIALLGVKYHIVLILDVPLQFCQIPVVFGL